MTLPELSIKRHVLAIMLSAVFVLFGLVGYSKIGLDRFPSIEFPVIAVTTILPGVNPEIIDSSITNIIETAVNSIPGINHIESKSSPGVSVVAITFNLSKPIDVGFNEVQAKINQIIRQLPADADPPIVAKVEVGAAPIMWLALQGDRTLQQLNQYASNVLKKRLETIDGVGEIRLGGKRDRTIRVNIDLQRLTALQLTAQDVIRSFGTQHLQFPAGFLISEATESLIKLDLEFHSISALEKMVVANRDGVPILLRDIAELEDGLDDYRQVAHYNGKPAVGIGIVKIAGTNTVAIAEEVKLRLDRDLRPALPLGVELNISTDDSEFIKQLVFSLQEHLILGTFLAAFVVLVFLKSIRSTLIISVAIPVSLLGAIAAIYFAGFTFNMLTLLALLLLVGVVVDDAIVVLENIFRHRETVDPDAVLSAINGTREVVFAVMAASLSIAAIFTPVIFLGGIMGRFFQSFAVVVVCGVLISWFVSMTLTPMLCSRYLKVQKRHNALYYHLENGFIAMENFYRRILAFSLRFRWGIIALTIILVFSSGFFFSNVGKTFIPDEDEGRFLVVFKTPLGSNIDYTKGRMELLEKVLAEESQVASYFGAIGMGQAGKISEGTIFVRLKSIDEREEHQRQIVNRVSEKFSLIPGVNAFSVKVAIIGGQRGEPLQFSLVGPNIDDVATYWRTSTIFTSWSQY